MPRVRFWLKVTGGKFAGRVFKFDTQEQTAFTIGRGEDRDVCFYEGPETEDLLISRKHGRIEWAPGGFQYLDESANGTLLNGKQLAQQRPVPLKHGAVLQLGGENGETVVRFECQEGAPPRNDRPTPSRDPQRPPREAFGEFAVYEALGDSDTDRVDRAVSKPSGKSVALKRFKNQKMLTSAARSRIRDAAEAAKQWKHPNIAAVLTCGDQEGTVYLARQFVNGGALVNLFDTAARQIDPVLAAYIVREACAALAYAESVQKNFVQRYLGHRNIMLGRDGRPLLINFGMPPVQLLLQPEAELSEMDRRFLSSQPKKIDSRSDVFSLGVILWELLSQQQADPKKVFALPPVQTVRPEIPASLAKITADAVVFNPIRRLGSPADMGDLLGEALAAIAPGYGAQQAADWMQKFAA